jgi:hypothetical protein
VGIIELVDLERMDVIGGVGLLMIDWWDIEGRYIIYSF